jgi:predicted dehydrogenase
MTLASGGMATISSTWAGHIPLFQFGVIGAEATMLVEHGKVRWKRADEPEIVLESNTEEDKINGLQRETHHFIECLKAGRRPRTSVYDGVATLKISHAVIKSSNEGTVVQIA